MLQKKFSYTKYEEFQKQQEYVQAQKYCASFPHDKNAVICELYSRSKSNAPLFELDTEIRIIGWSVGSKKYRGYEKNVLYLLGELLFERGFETEGGRVLHYVASLEKMKEKISEAEKKARLYLEHLYFQKWENSHEMADLKQAADCFGHSSVCYLYAELLREKGGDQDQEEAIPYETVNAMCYCVIWMDRITYYQTRGKERQDQILDDIRKDIGFIASDMAMVKAGLGRIESHMETMIQMIHNLPETTRNALHQDFNRFRTQMSELSEQMEDQEESVRSLVEMVQALDLDPQGGQDTIRELKALAEQIKAVDQDREDRLVQSINGLKSAILDNLLLKEIVDEAMAEINGRFQDRLSPDAKESIVTALFTLNFYKKINKNKEQESLIEYSGVVILAATALEIELRSRLYDHFKNYIEARYGEENLKVWYRQPFTLGSFGFITGVELGNKEWDQNKREKDQMRRKQRFREFIRDPASSRMFSTNPGSLFQYGSKNKSQRRLLENFSERLKDLRKIRNKAAHIESVTLEEAENACRWSFLSPQERASKITEESISLLELLLNSCN